MRFIANTATIRAGAQRFASAGLELRQNAMKIEKAANVLTTGADGWQGRGADAYHNAAQHIHVDIKTSSDAFQRVASVLSSLASQLDQVNQYRQQANQLEVRIHSLQSELWNADEYRRESIRDQISSLRYRLHDYDRQADFIENQANRNAGAAFDDLASMANRLYFGQGSSVQERLGEFFVGLWGKAKDAADLVGDELTEAFDDTTHFFKEKFKEAQEGGLLGMFIGFFEGMGKSLLDTIEGLWSLTPSAAVYKAVTDWEGTKEKAAKIFYEYTHPVETAQARLEFIKGIPAMAKVVASTAVDSIERDLINGNAYTRSKWAGYAAGMIVESIGTLGAGEAGKVAKSTQVVTKISDDVVHAATKADDLAELHRAQQISEAIQVARTELTNHREFLKSGGILKPSGGKYKPNVISAVVDSMTKQVYFGYNGVGEGRFNPSVSELHPELQKYIDRTKELARNTETNIYKDHDSFEDWAVENCAEIYAVNQAFYAGVKLEDILISTIRFSDGNYKPLCDNCEETFIDFLIDARDQE